jgi:hypothetical protein
MDDDFLYKSILLDQELLNKYINQKPISDSDLSNVLKQQKLDISVETFANLLGLSSAPNQNGLYIAFHKISKLSGPSSFTLLTPKNDQLPIIMLLGDSHDTIEKQCNKCNCSLSSQECCLKTFEDKFLKNLDLLSSPSHPIDIYVEGFSYNYNKVKLEDTLSSRISSLESRYKVNHQMYMMKHNYFICFDDIRKLDKEDKNYSLYEKYCPTKMIRWNFADPRISEIDNVLETQIFNTVCFFLNSTFNLKSKVEDTSFQLLQKLIFIPYEFFKILVDDKNSLIGHEFLQIPVKIQDEIKKCIVEYIIWIRNSTPNIEEVKKILQLESSKLTNIDVFHCLIHITSFITEIYSFLRILQSTPKPWLQIIIMSHKHCQNFINFLVNIYKKYNIKVNLGSENVILDFIHNKLNTTSQCIDFDNQKVHLVQLYQEIYGKELSINYENFNNKFYNKFSSIHLIRKLYLQLEFSNLIETNNISMSKINEIFNTMYKNLPNKQIISHILRLNDLENEINLFYNILIYIKKDNFNYEISTKLKEQILEGSKFHIDDSLYVFFFQSLAKYDNISKKEIWNLLVSIKPPSIEIINSYLSRDLYTMFIINVILGRKVFPNNTTLDQLEKLSLSYKNQIIKDAIDLCKNTLNI